jgi:hypothetical protein
MNIRELINSMPVLAKALVLSAILGGAWACFSYLHWEHTPQTSRCECVEWNLTGTQCARCCNACINSKNWTEEELKLLEVDCKCGENCGCANCCPGN